MPRDTGLPADGSSTERPEAFIRQMIMGLRDTQMIHAAARLRLADLLAPGPRLPVELAAEAGADPAALARLMRALAARGVFDQLADGRYAANAASRQLETGRSFSFHALALLYGSEWLGAAYARLPGSVLTGEPGFARAHGTPFYDWLATHPEAAETFARAMSAFSAQEAAAILNAFDSTDVRRVVDVGGGTGALVAALLHALPGLTATILERPEMAERAERTLREAGLADRVRCVGGDAFADVPPGGDAYLLKSVLHNWDDEAAIVLLRACRRAMRDDARVVVIERVVPDGPGPSEAKLFDINMLAVTGGRERSLAEYAALLAAAGFATPRLTPTRSPVSLIEARPAIDTP
jgi:predicted O-methyltransferase YrrM